MFIIFGIIRILYMYHIRHKICLLTKWYLPSYAYTYIIYTMLSYSVSYLLTSSTDISHDYFFSLRRVLLRAPQQCGPPRLCRMNYRQKNILGNREARYICTQERLGNLWAFYGRVIAAQWADTFYLNQIVVYMTKVNSCWCRFRGRLKKMKLLILR